MQQRSFAVPHALHSDPTKEKEKRNKNRQQKRSAKKIMPDSQSRILVAVFPREQARFLMWYIAEQENDQMSVLDGD